MHLIGCICYLVLCNYNKVYLYSSSNSALQYNPTYYTFYFRRTARLACSVFPLFISSLTGLFLFRLLWQGCTNPACQIARVTRFCSVAPNICGLSAWNLLHFTLLAPRIFGWLLEFRKICVPLTCCNFPARCLNECLWLQA